MRCEVMLAVAPVRRTWQPFREGALSMRAMVTCRVALESNPQVGVRLISHRQQAALWRHLHCGFISCCLHSSPDTE